VCEQIDFKTAHTIFEYGAGEGTLTRHLLSRAARDTQLYGFETNAALVAKLEKAVIDPRLTLLQDSAEQASRLAAAQMVRADVVVSGIPFSLFSDSLAQAIIHSTLAAMAPGGVFVVYQAWLPPFATTTRLQGLLAPYFALESAKVVLLNLPPLQVLRFRRR
jgi:phospholipid N-methyltransferase